MPVDSDDLRAARSLSREARRFATLVSRIKHDKTSPAHPEIKAALESFRKINGHLSYGKGPGVVSLSRKVRIGAEFQKLGAAVRGRPKSRSKR